MALRTRNKHNSPRIRVFFYRSRNPRADSCKYMHSQSMFCLIWRITQQIGVSAPTSLWRAFSVTTFTNVAQYWMRPTYKFHSLLSNTYPFLYSKTLNAMWYVRESWYMHYNRNQRQATSYLFTQPCNRTRRQMKCWQAMPWCIFALYERAYQTFIYYIRIYYNSL